MVTLSKLDSFDAHRLHRKLSLAWREADEHMARRIYRMMSRVYLHLHKSLLEIQ
jgi:hypothetical protein